MCPTLVTGGQNLVLSFVRRNICRRFANVVILQLRTATESKFWMRFIGFKGSESFKPNDMAAVSLRVNGAVAMQHVIALMDDSRINYRSYHVF